MGTTPNTDWSGNCSNYETDSDDPTCSANDLGVFGHLVMSESSKEEEEAVDQNTRQQFEQLLAVLRSVQINQSSSWEGRGEGSRSLGAEKDSGGPVVNDQHGLVDGERLQDIFCKLFQDDFTAWDYLVMCIYGLIVVISLFGNGLVFSVIIRTRRLHTITNLFIANLSLGDLLMTTFNIPFTVVRIMVDDWPFGSFMCSFVPFTQSVSVFVSSYTMTAIAVDRYQAGQLY